MSVDSEKFNRILKGLYELPMNLWIPEKSNHELP